MRGSIVDPLCRCQREDGYGARAPIINFDPAVFTRDWISQGQKYFVDKFVAQAQRRPSASGRNLRSSQHGAGIAVASDGDDLAVRDVNVLCEGNDAEDGVDVYYRDAMLTVDNQADDLDALHDAGEVIEAFPEGRSASIRVGRELANSVWMERKRGDVVVPHGIDILLDHLYHLFAHETLHRQEMTEYSPETGFRYEITAEGGSSTIQSKVLKAVLDGGRDAIANGEMARSSLAPSNYAFQPNGIDADGFANVLLARSRKPRTPPWSLGKTVIICSME